MACVDEINPLIRRYVERLEPRRLLVICRGASALPDRCEQWQPSGAELYSLSPETAPEELEDEIYDLALIGGALHCIPKSHGENLIARLRDVQAKRLLVELVAADTEAGWSRADMLALGLRRLEEEGKNAQTDVYEFNIATYKKTPDWLNPKYWAHPERWDQERW